MQSLLESVGERGIKVWLDGTQFRVRAPKGAMTKELAEELKTRKDEVMTFLQARTEAREAEAGIESVPRDQPLVLSSPQRRLWVLDQMETGKATYHMTGAYRMRGHLDHPALEQAATALTARHEVLRTTFFNTEDGPRQHIAPPGPFVIPVTPTTEAALNSRLNTHNTEPFDLTVGPLMRLHLFKLTDTEHVLSVVKHHIISDGWSIAIAVRELGLLYSAFVSGQTPELPLLPIQYADYAAWQQRVAVGPRAEKQKTFWIETLRNAPELLELPTDRPRPALRTHAGAVYRFRLDPALIQTAEAHGKHLGATLFMVLETAFALLMQRYSGRTDVVVGTPAAGRNRKELEPLIGFFVNTQALRHQLDTAATFDEILAQGRDIALAAFAHADLPFEMVVDAVQPTRNPSAAPIFQVMFQLQKITDTTPRLPGLTMVAVDSDIAAAKFDLTLSLLEINGALRGEVEYNTDLFNPETIARMMDSYRTLLASALSNPDMPVKYLNLITAADRTRLLEELCGARPIPQPCSDVAALFEAVAARQPEAPALREVGRDGRSKVIAYAQLNARANALALKLREAGVQAEVVVGVCAEPLTDCLIALWAVLKAGGVYMPMDAAYPPQRLSFMMEDAAPALVLADATGIATIDAGDIPLWSLAENTINQAPSPPVRHMHSMNAAYLIFTSGSTGRPKGVAVTHGGLQNLIDTFSEIFEIHQGRRRLQLASLNFDASMAEIIPALCSGSELVLASRELKQPGESLTRLVREHDINYMIITPPVLAVTSFENTPSLRALEMGGEAVSTEVADRFGQRLKLTNGYGPTETTVCCSHALLTGAGTKPTIGRPDPGVRLYILDADFELTPPGVSGELCIAHIGLARGYYGRPDLTAERFVPDPFTSLGEGTRLYRSGDLARFLPNGNIDFLGRIDHQVKLRGLRIELGEIETVLDVVVNASVVVLDASGPAKRLIAFVTADDKMDESTVRAHLSACLPDYMVPARIQVLPNLPVNASGKIDRKALQALAATPADETTHVALCTPAEHTLAGIWARILGRETVSADANFFELGGDSILAIQVVTQARHAGLTLEPRDLFQYKTLSALAAACGNAPVVTAEQGPVGGDLVLTPIQRWFFGRPWPNRNHFNHAVLLAVSGGPMRQDALHHALAHLIDHHDALRLRFTQEDGSWRARFGEPGGPVPLTFTDLSALAAEERGKALSAEIEAAQRSLDIQTGRLLCARHFNFGAQEPTRLLLVIHHLVVDGVSWRILLEDLERAYTSNLSGASSEPVLKTTSLQTWSRNLQDMVQRGGLERGAGYWQAEERREACALPVDFRTPSGVLYTGNLHGEDNLEAHRAEVLLTLSPETTRAIVEEVPAAWNLRAEELMLTALFRAVHRWCGVPRLLVDLEGHGREPLVDADLSRTVGWFTNVYPVHLGCDQQDPGMLLRTVKQQLRQVPDKGMGLNLLRAYGDTPSLNDMPQAPVAFNYLGRFDNLFSGSQYFQPADEPTGTSSDPKAPRPHLLEINGIITGDALSLILGYSARLHRRETMQALAGHLQESLEELAAYCKAHPGQGMVPADFPLATLHQEELDLLAQQVDDIEDLYPLTPMQAGMLFHFRMDNSARAYFEQTRCTIEGALDVSAFMAAWQHLIDRHSILRTSFHWEDLAVPVQVVHCQAVPEWRREDLSRLGPAEREACIEAVIQAERDRGFNLNQAPCIRFVLLRLSHDRHVFAWFHHHMLLDGWSMPLVFDEAQALYRAEKNGVAIDFPPALPFRDFVAWLAARDEAADRAFWSQQLQDMEAQPPMTLSGETTGAFAHGECKLALGNGETAALQTLARDHRVTMSTLVQAAWALLLSIYTRSSEVVFGVTVSGRPADLPDIARRIGLFINTQPVRTAVPNGPLTEWLEDLQQEQADREAHAHVPLAQIQAWAGLPGDRPLFDTLVVFENYPLDDVLSEAGGDLAFRNPVMLEHAHYPLVLIAMPGTQLSLRLQYDAGRFPAASVERLLGRLRNLFHHMGEQPTVLPRDLPLLDQGEREILIHRFNDTTTTYPSRANLAELVLARSAERPDALAVHYPEGEPLTYGQFADRVQRLAVLLRARGVSLETPVGLAMPRTIDMITAMTAVLLAGGCYVPLDPDYPAERLSWMIEDAGIELLLTTSATVLPQTKSTHHCVLTLDTIDMKGESVPLPAIGGGGHPAYLIYTSGSTGKPKGAVIPHRAVTRLLLETNYIRIQPDDRVAQTANANFDAVTFEVWGALLHGAALIGVSTDLVLEPERCALRLRECRVSILWLTTSLFHNWAVQLPGAFKDMRVLLFGGETVDPTKVARVLEAGGPQHLINCYGPTESTTFTTTHDIAQSFDGTCPIGKPVSNTTCYVLDTRMNPAGIGVTGELYIGGDGLARGYLGRAGLTAERFVPHPFAPAHGLRLYRTGDLVHIADNGDITYLGRTDHQVKIRGFRIEPGEVETVLRDAPGVSGAAVLVDETAKQLAAHIILEGGRGLDAVRGRLVDQLPAYMMPTRFIVHERFPLTPNGKLDRKALAAAAMASAEDHVTPHTPAEVKLAAVWRDILDVDRVGASDNFFELGGHSLLVTRLATQLRAQMDRELPLSVLFETPVLADQALLLDGAGAMTTPTIGPAAQEGPLPLSFAQQRLWFLDKLEPGAANYNVPLFLRLRGVLHHNALEAALAVIVERHQILRTVFPEREGTPVQLVEPFSPPQLPLTDLSGDVEAEALLREMIAEEITRVYDLQTGPLYHADLTKLDDAHHVLLFSMHHIISDGWSLGVLAEELETGYRRTLGEDLPALPPLPVQYGDFAVWQRSRLQGAELERQLTYWRTQLADAPELLELPTDRPRPDVQTSNGGLVTFTLNAHLQQALNDAARTRGQTSFLVLETAFAALLSRYSGQTDVVVGTPVANRNRAEIESLIGFFVNTLALRHRQDPAASFTSLLDAAKQTHLDAWNHQDLPFEQVVDALEVPRALSHAPVFQVSFALQNMPLKTPQLPGLTLEQIPLETAAPKFDLSVTLTEQDNGLVGAAEYNADLFDEGTIAAMMRAYQVLLTAVSAQPQTALSQIPLLDEAALKQQLETWNGNTRPVYCGRIEDLIAEVIARYPDNAALVTDTERITYAELDARAEVSADRLAAAGAGPEKLVGIFADRSTELVTAMVATLRAGAAFLPLDPSLPSGRLKLMLDDAQPAVIALDPALRSQLPSASAALVSLDASDTPPARITSLRHAESPAYIIYTSGSTGRPNGVAVTHRGLSNLTETTHRTMDMDADSRMLQFASSGFDASIWEIFSALTAGAELHLAPRAALMPGEPLLETLASRGITITLLPPTALAAMTPGDLPQLKTVVSGGEACSAEIVQRWAPSRAFFNAYGPTENTVMATLTACSPGEGIPLLGHGLPNVSLYVLDRTMQPLPVGVPGELHVGGLAMARGYLKRPALSAARFVPHPFGKPGERLYKTGDLVRFLPDGRLAFLGRVDHQVKLRGFRIELGEIEAALAALPGVTNVVVSLQETGGPKQLAAHFAGDAMTPGSLRQQLETDLPGYMIPSRFIHHPDGLPLNASGKVDRKALGAFVAGTRQAAFVAPATEAEQKLALIWTGLLGREDIGADDNFFELGGDSITSIQLVAWARQAGLLLSPKLVFQHQTLAGMARVAGSVQTVTAGQGPVTGPVPLTPIQTWFLDKQWSNPHHFNQAVMLAAEPGMQRDALQQALDALLHHHDMLRVRLHQADGSWTQELSEPGEVATLAVVNLADRDDWQEELARLAEETQAGLRLTKGPIFRALYAERGNQPGRLLLAVHHMAVDGVSWRILLEDLLTAYGQAAAGEAVALLPKTTDFQTWARRLPDATALVKTDYWTTLADIDVAPLPLDMPGGPALVRDECQVSLELDVDLTTDLLTRAGRAYRTRVDDLLLAALARAFQAWTGDARLLLDLESHGRESLWDDMDLSRTVGWFTAIYPVLLDVSHASEPADLVPAVKEQLRAVPDGGIGYGLSAPAQPIQAEVAFNYLGRFDQVLAPEGPLGPAGEGTGAQLSPDGVRTHSLTVTAAVTGDGLQLNIAYAGNRHHRETITRLLASFRAELIALIQHCTVVEQPGLTPSDVPMVRVDQATLDRLAPMADLYPLTPLQEGMLFQTRYQEDAGAYFNQIRCTLRGKLDEDAFRDAWLDVANRHAALRTTFHWQGLDQPLQRVADTAQLPWIAEDWRGETDTRQRLEDFAREDRQRGFQLEGGPLMRCALLRIDNDARCFIWSHHHLLLDGWSLPILLGEVLTAYRARLDGASPNLPRPPAFSDFVAWVHDRDTVEDMAFWTEHLEGLEGPTPLPMSAEPRIVAGEETRGQLIQSLDAAATGALLQLSRDRKVTLSTLVQATWALLLARTTDRNDVTFGVTVSGRPADLPNVARRVGLYINTVPARCRLPETGTVTDWLQTLQQEQVAREARSWNSLTDIAQSVGMGAGAALFETLVVFENYPLESTGGDEAPFRLEAFQAEDQTHYPLTLIAASGETIKLRLQYDAGRYTRADAARLLDLVRYLLKALAGNPTASPADMYPPASGDIAAFASGPVTTVASTDLCRLFQSAADRFSGDPAVIFGEETLTFAELSEQADRLAHVLLQHGAGHGRPVAVSLERSTAMTVAVLATLKAGSPYLPIDPVYPAERRAMMLGDSGAPVLIARGDDDLSGPFTYLDWDVLQPLMTTAPATAPTVTIQAENPAYILYTSGSTGIPKGVVMSHGALANLIHWQLHDQPGRLTTLQFASLSFDVSFQELWSTWAAGGTLVLIPESERADVAALLALIERHQVARLFMPYVALHHLASGCERLPDCLRHVVTAGEQLQTPPALTRLFQGENAPRLHNQYGPTEAHVVTAHTLDAEAGDWPALPPIGRPIANASIRIVDRRMREVPMGVPGELLIGGVAPATGYWERPALTAQKFVPDPFSTTPGARLYRSGDLAVWLNDGNIQYLGRIDQQVKVRGFRVEPGEVETVLTGTPGVKQAAVTVFRDASGGQHLAAYLVGTDDVAVARKHLQENLPAHMVPGRFVCLEALPLTPSGKLDRKRLPKPDQVNPGADYVAPRTPMEAQIAAIWADVLELERVGVRDNFFDIGGHSLLATRVISRVEEARQVTLPLRFALEEPTVEGFAQRLDLFLRIQDQGQAPGEALAEDEEELSL
ncbi:MAG: amino acid adenylation domain-containing protein [Acidobacteriota bacterium]|nr:amino acid adenylation domain-containing protein [Acidobacteriota bacterium]